LGETARDQVRRMTRNQETYAEEGQKQKRHKAKRLSGTEAGGSGEVERDTNGTKTRKEKEGLLQEDVGRGHTAA
jgi:hypothetical protein